MSLPPGLVHVISQTRLFTDARTYVIVRATPDQWQEATAFIARITEPFVGMVRDKDEMSMVLPRELWEEMRPVVKGQDISPDYRLITFDLPLDLGLDGYLATLTQTLAESGVSIFAVSAFSRDHVFVLEEDFDRAWDALRSFIRSCQDQDET